MPLYYLRYVFMTFEKLIKMMSYQTPHPVRGRFIVLTRNLPNVMIYSGNNYMKITMNYTRILIRSGKGTESRVDDLERSNEDDLYRNHTSPCTKCRICLKTM